jgi:prolyl-tRNA synthetase
LPIYRNDQEQATVLDYCRKLQQELKNQPFADGRVQVILDNRDLRGGEKVWHHVKRGVPIRLEIGPRDIQSDSVFMARRDKPPTEKKGVPRGEFVATVSKLLDEMQQNLFQRAIDFRQQHTRTIDDRRELETFFTPRNVESAEIHGGFALAHIADDPAATQALEAHKLTVRCIPLEGEAQPGTCLITRRPVPRRVVVAKAY